MNWLRVGIGISSLALAAGATTAMEHLHVDWIRGPLITLAVAGSGLNLVVLWQIRRLRRRPEAAWRQKTPGSKRLRMERVQLIFSIVTLVLVFFEERQHLIWLHHL